ncbi:SecDF P1 head subdomain-containing protein [Thioalkalivibrio nitratireducens]|uniref:SecDF P1 head subdomain-containing protein n=1 Tax=Thioalkalivibrio nitratireducens TaxID=186931 RepID=UPI003AAAC8C4
MRSRADIELPGHRLLPPHAEGRPVFIKSTESGSASFEDFTEETRGRVIRIVLGDREFMAARITAPIPSGRLQGTFSSRDAAVVCQRMLAGELPASPCGAGDAERLNVSR